MPLQKPTRSKQDYGTPPEFLRAVRALLHVEEWDWDLAADDQNRVGEGYYGAAQNSLVQPWKLGEGWNWLNPPFGKLGPWVEKAYWAARDEAEGDEGARIAMLVPAGVGTKWWAEWVHMKAFCYFFRPRLTFVGETAPYPKDCALLLYSPEDMPGYGLWKWK